MSTASMRNLVLAVVVFAAALPSPAAGQEAKGYRLATFSADVTPAVGSPLLGGASMNPKATGIDDALFVQGIVLLGDAKPLVIATIDWCEIRNDAYDRWRDALAEAAGTTRERVLFASIHQHDTPLADLEAQRILDASKLGGKLIDLDFHERCVQRAAKALRAGLAAARPITHFGIGKAKVDKVSSNRRFFTKDGKLSFNRSSMSGGKPEQRDAPDGTIDPWLRTLSFWNGETPVAALHVYAVHPMSHWGAGKVTADFPGLARKRRQADDAGVFQMYASGASGNVTAGKYNDGNPGNRTVLADRLYQAMLAAWKSTEKKPLERAQFRNVPFRLDPRATAQYTEQALHEQLQDPRPNRRSIAALGLSWRKHAGKDRKLDLPVIDFGAAQVLLLPGEVYVEFQLKAQELRPDSFVIAIGYGECATGYVPVESAWDEQDGNLDPWCWVGPGAEKILVNAMKQALSR